MNIYRKSAILPRSAITNEVSRSFDCQDRRFKETFIERHYLNENTRLEKILTNFYMGNRRLPEFYRNLLMLGGSNFIPEVIKKLWFKKLSMSLSVALIGSNVKNINELVKLSDDFREMSNHSGAHTLAVTSSDTNN
uniref:Uncharacterized protein n=1 Tax=Glossina pallidipes TaxID=7398 RepID=A0A1A9ZM45_GLOPL